MANNHNFRIKNGLEVGGVEVITANGVMLLPSTSTATTQDGGTSNTRIATTAFVQQEITTLIGGAPGSLNTLNELAAAINDDASYASTLTTALATKLPLAGGTLTGTITINQGGSFSKLDIKTSRTSATDNIGGVQFYNSSNALRSQMYGTNDGKIKFATNGSTVSLTLDASQNATFAGTITATGGNSGQWNTAYGWGNHASAGYLTSSSTQSKYLRSDAADSGGTTTGSSLNIPYLKTNMLLVGATNFGDTINGAPWYGLGKSTLVGYHSNNSTMSQLANYWGLRLQTATARMDMTPTGYQGNILFGAGTDVSGTTWARINSTGLYQGLSNLVWHAGNDGSGSGLDADTLDSYHASTTRNSANTIPVRDSNGYLHLGWINTTSGGTTTASSDYYVNTADGYIRKKTLANVKTEIMGVSSGSSFLRSDATDVATGKITLQYGETSDLNSVGGSRGVTAFHTANVGQTSNRPDSGNYATGLEFTYYDASARSQLAAGSGGSNNTAAFYVRSEAWGATNSWTSWYKLFHTGNDGSGSGLDADLLDGVQASSFLRSDATDTATGALTFTSTSNHYHGHHYFDAWDVNGNHYPHYLSGSSNNGAQVNLRVQQSGGSGYDVLYIPNGSNNITWRGNNVWNAGNDGSGSGLDADLLDGQHGSYYYSSANPPPGEADTLATVTGRGATTSTQSSFNSGIITQANGIRLSRTQANSSIWFNGVSGADLNHALWNAAYGTTPTSRPGTSGAFDGMMWNAYRGLHLRGGAAGAYNIIVAENSNGSTNDHTVKLYASNVLRLSTTTSGVTIGGTLTATGGNSTNWNTAYGWGNHASAGYLTSVPNHSAALITSGNVANARMSTAYLATRLGLTAHSLTTLNTTALWSQPAGYQTMVKASTSTGLPSSHGQSYFGYNITSRRDGAGGYSALLTSYDNSNMYFTYNTVNTAYPTWRKIWHDSNDGSGSGLDADMVDGKHKDFLMHYKGLVSGNWDTIFSQTDGHMGVYEVQSINNTDTNWPTGAYTFGGVMSWQLDNSTFKLYAPHTGQLHYQTGWNNDEYSGWRKIWDTGNDGSGSGLDADLLDGNHASAFATSAQGTLATNALPKAGGTLTGTLTTAGNIVVPANTGFQTSGTETKFTTAHGYIQLGPMNTSYAHIYTNIAGGFYFNKNNLYANGNIMWHVGNDGAGSGLDADLLDGQQGSYYRPATQTTTLTGAVTGSGTTSITTSNPYQNSVVFSTNGPDSVMEYAQSSGVTDTKLAPTTDWYNSIRMGHGDPYSYYSSTIAMQMTGTGYGQIKTQSIQNNTAAGWRTQWDSGNDGSGSTLDADLLDGQQGSYYYSSANPPPTYSKYLRSDTDDTVTAGTTYTFPASDSPAIISTRGNGGASLYVGGWQGGANSNNIHRISSSSNLHIDSAANGNLYLNYYRGGTTYIGGSNVAWHAGNDGSGSGLDADLLDGQQGSYYAPASSYLPLTGGTLTGNLNGTTASFSGKVDFQGDAAIEGASGYGVFKGYTANSNHFIAIRGIVANQAGLSITGGHQTTFVEHAENNDTSGWFFKSNQTGSYAEIARITRTGGMHLQGNKVWHAGNDGSGSTLDADLLDGQHGSYYTNPTSLPANGGNADTVDNMHFHNQFGVGEKIDFTVGGDAATYYPVVISGGGGSVVTDFQIYRGYSETAPAAWGSSTHMGGLAFNYKIVGSSGWGGHPTSIRVQEFGEIYRRILGGIAFTAHTMKHVVWLRGGTATYHIWSNADISVEVNDSTSASNYVSASPHKWYSYDHSNASYDVTVSERTSAEANTGVANEVYLNMPVSYNSAGTPSVYGIATSAYNHKFWNSSNDGSGSGLDADLLDGQHASAFLTAEADTLATVTGRGASTTTAITINNQLSTTNTIFARKDNVTNYTDAQVRLDSYGGSSSTTGLGFHISGSVGRYLFMNSSADLFWNSTSSKIWHASNDGSGSGLAADSASTIYTTQTAGTNATHYPTFVSTNASGQKSLKYDPGMMYNPSTNTLGDVNFKLAGTLTGSCTGNAATVTQNHSDGGGNYPILWKSGSTTYYTDEVFITASTNTVRAYQFALTAGNSNGIKFWNGSSTYAITMGDNQNNHGTVTDYSMHHEMGTTAGRGFTFGPSRAGVTCSINAITGAILSNNNITAYSDIRIKDNIEVIPNALDKVSQLSGYTFTRTDVEDKEERYTGVIAQEVLKVLPEAVQLGATEEDTMSVAYGNMVGLMIEAIKELKSEVDDLKTQLSQKGK